MLGDIFSMLFGLNLTLFVLNSNPRVHFLTILWFDFSFRKIMDSRNIVSFILLFGLN